MLNRKLDLDLIKKSFSKYLFDDLFIDRDIKQLIEILISSNEAHIFGGVIRDYIWSNQKNIRHKDIDIVVNEIDVELKKYLSPFIKKYTRFGGYKLFINKVHFDIWPIDSTWVIRRFPTIFKNQFYRLSDTSFFNITAITYSLNTKDFLYNSNFKSSYEKNLLDIVYEPNPFPALCFIKSYEYKVKYNLKLSNNLSNYLINHYTNISKKEFDDTQLQHYGKKQFTNFELHQFYHDIKRKHHQDPKSRVKSNIIKYA